MKIGAIATAVACLLVVGGGISLFWDRPSFSRNLEAPKSVAVSPSPAKPLRIGVVDFDRLVKLYGPVEAEEARLDKRWRQLRREWKKLQATDTAGAQAFAKSYGNEIQTATIQARDRIAAELQERIHQAARQHDLDLVFNSSGQMDRGVPAVLGTSLNILDLTEEVAGPKPLDAPVTEGTPAAKPKKSHVRLWPPPQPEN